MEKLQAKPKPKPKPKPRIQLKYHIITPDNYDVNKASQKTEPPLILNGTKLFDNLAKLIPPPHRHRHHYHGVLAPNSKQRAKVTQFANHYYRPDRPDTTENRALQDEHNIEAAASKLNLQPQPKTGSKTWARLIAKVYEVDTLKARAVVRR